MTKSFDNVIIGGGASGLMLAANIELDGARGIILEGSSCIGSKLLMSGGGRCNITHGGSIKDFLFAYGDKGPLLRKCLYRHSNADLMKWLEDHGVKLTDENGRIFPASMRARYILDAFHEAAERNGWQIRTGAKVSGLSNEEDHFDVTLENGETLGARNVVIATGGITYPETGSDGSMFKILKGIGAEITEPRSALAPVYIEDYPYADLAGISIKDVTATVLSSDAACICKGKAVSMTGDVLFTHDGLSGPAILNISGYAESGGKISLSYNKDLQDLPKRMQRVLQDRARGESGDIKTTVLASLLVHDDFTVRSVDSRGMVTAGGVSLEELDMHTMRMKRVDGIYVIGEAIDADGITGGYNLQMCWSTACAAADDIRKNYSV